MGYSYKSYSDTKEVFKKFVNAAEGQAVYGISRSHIMEMAKKAGAVYKVGNTALINTEIFGHTWSSSKRIRCRCLST